MKKVYIVIILLLIIGAGFPAVIRYANHTRKTDLTQAVPAGTSEVKLPAPAADTRDQNAFKPPLLKGPRFWG